LIRFIIAAGLGFAALTSVYAVSSAAPVLGPAQVTSPSSPIIEVDRRCGSGRHYVPRRRVRGRDGRLHWVGGACARG
jgi:hypothetical protein